jgi:hypothetical protein
MSTEDYHNKIKAVLNEPVHMKLKKDPTSIVEKRTSSLIKSKSQAQAKIIMIPKPGKTSTDVASYRSIRLLPVIS